MFSVLLSRLIILLFGTLYPAYASYKAIRTKCVKEYVKWMMYWIVFAFFTFIETFTDIFCSWFPFYYEIKIVLLLWLLSPATKGSSTLYRKFVHPLLTRHEEEIEQYINEAKERGYSVVFQLGTKGVNYATNVIMQTAIKGGGNLVQTFKKSYSLSDISETDSVQPRAEEHTKVIAVQPQQRILRPRAQAALTRSASGSRHSTGMYFSETNVNTKKQIEQSGNVRSAEDISSGYSSAEPHSLATTTMKTRARGRRGEMVVSDGGGENNFGTVFSDHEYYYNNVYDDDDNDDDMLYDDPVVSAFIEEDEQKEEEEGQGDAGASKISGAQQFCYAYADLLTTPHHYSTNTYTIDAKQILNLMRLMELKSDATSVISEINETNDHDSTETFADCSNISEYININNNNKSMTKVRRSTKKRRAPAPPISSNENNNINNNNKSNCNNTCDDTASISDDINLNQFDDNMDLSFRKRSKSDLSTTSSTTSSRSLLKGFFRMKNPL